MKKSYGIHKNETGFRKNLVRLQIAGTLLLIATLIAITYKYEGVRIGEGIILALAAIALVTRVPSLEIFKIALAMLVLVPVLSVAAPYSELPDAFSVYAFLVVCTGVILALIETLRGKLHRRYEASVRKTTDRRLRAG